MKYFKKVKGERVYLSPINLDDAAQHAEWMSDIEITRFLTTSHRIFNTESERSVLQRIADDNFSIVLSDGDILIGSCGFVTINELHRTAEVGIYIGDKNYLSQGYGTEATRLLLDFAFNIRNCHCVSLRANSLNERAIKSYEKCGFKYAGRYREYGKMHGKYFDCVMMDILEDEFRGKVGR